MSSSPKWFRPVAVIALVWNLFGCAAYLADASISSEQLSTMSAAQQAHYAERPSWSVAATAIAVWFGAAGCVGLILRKKWATWLLLASLAGVLAQDLWLFVMSASAREAGAAFVLQGLVLVISVALVVLARRAVAQGWIS